MKPCKIEAMIIGKRPVSAKKIMSSQAQRMNSGSKTAKNSRKRIDDINEFDELKGSQNIAPWAQIDDDFLIN